MEVFKMLAENKMRLCDMLNNNFVSPSNLVIDKLYLVYDFSGVMLLYFREFGVRLLYFREFDYDDSGNVVSLLFSDSFSYDAFFIRFYLVDFVGFFIEYVECEDYLQ